MYMKCTEVVDIVFKFVDVMCILHDRTRQACQCRVLVMLMCGFTARLRSEACIKTMCVEID